jgi:sugar transferase (PEP-CTERM/EpsH1 system associated)
MGNGVDIDYFTPQQIGASPYLLGELALVLTGAMDYWPNIDAACWFARRVLPGVRRRLPHAHFYVVGNRPSSAVQALGGLEGVTVTGFVDDIRPWIGHAALALAPLRVARGVQNKVLEAMALGRPVVATSEALEGLSAVPEEEVSLAEAEVESFTRAILNLLGSAAAAEAMGEAARQRVINDYSWAQQLERLDDLLALDPLPQAPPREHRQSSAAGGRRTGAHTGTHTGGG